MKSGIKQIAVVAAGLLVLPLNSHVAQGQILDTVLQGIKNSTESSSMRDRSRRDDRGRDDDNDSWRSEDRHRSSGGRYSDDPDAIVRRAYEDILNREPDQEGLRLYRSKIIDNNWSEKDVRNDLRHSKEYKGQTPEKADMIIRRAYQDVLGRDADAAGLATYRSKLLYEGWSERDVRSDLKDSQERHMTGGIPEDQARDMVRRAYQTVLGREPDSGSEVYVQKIRQNHWSEKDVAGALRNSPEYRQKHGRK